MIVWENRNRYRRDGWMGPAVSELIRGLEDMGSPVIQRYNTPNYIHHHDKGLFWYKDNKVWEYPFVCQWLEEQAAILGKKTLKVMDFGCWICPFPEYLASMGHEVWGVDDDSWGHMAKCNVAEHYPNVHYFMDDLMKLEEGNFDAIFSCSVFEHISPDSLRVSLMEKMRSMLAPEGKMVHVVDFYFPEKPGRESQRMDFYKVAMAMGWDCGDSAMCPGSPTFDFSKARVPLKSRFIREQCQEARIAIGDDIRS